MHTLFLWLRTLLNLDFTGGFDMAFPFESDIEFSLILGCGFGEDFFIAGGLPSLRPLETFMNNSKPFGCLLLAACGSRRERTSYALSALQSPAST
jgi:hypothetical protein